MTAGRRRAAPAGGGRRDGRAALARGARPGVAALLGRQDEPREQPDAEREGGEALAGAHIAQAHRGSP